MCSSDLRAAAGDDTDLIRFEPPDVGQRFDVLPLSVVTDGAVQALGVDRRRLRPNIVVGGVEGVAERGWPGRILRIGDTVEIEIRKLRARCVMTTYDPDTLEQDLGVLGRIVHDFDGRIALDCAVRRGGRISVGDPVEV